MAARKVIQYSSVPNYGDNFDVVGGHGTHTTGTMVGSITSANGDYSISKFFSFYSYYNIDSMNRREHNSISNNYIKNYYSYNNNNKYHNDNNDSTSSSSCSSKGMRRKKKRKQNN